MQPLLNTIKQEPIIFMFRKWWTHTNEQKGYLAVAIILLITAFSIRMIEPLILSHLLNYVQANELNSETLRHILFIISWFLLSTIVFSLIRFLGEYHKANVSFISTNYYKKYLFTNVINKNLNWLHSYDSGDIIDKTNTATESLLSFSRNSHKIIEIVVRFVGSYIAIAFFYLPSMWIIPIVLIPIWVLIITFDRYLVQYYKILNEFSNNISAKLFDAFSNINSIVILGLKEGVSSAFSNKVDEPVPAFKKQMLIFRAKWSFTGILFYTVIVIIMSLYVFQTYNEGSVLEIGALSALFLYLTRLGHGFYDLVGNYGEVIRNKTNILNAEILEGSDGVTEKREERYFPSNLAIKNLSFGYNDQEKIALDKINIQFNQGEKIALIGQSGSGKTTFLKVLHGLYEGVEGQLSIDSQAITAPLHELDLGTTLVPQEPELFSSSVTENITFGLDYSEEEIRTVTDLAQFTEVAETLPNGFDSKINEKGVNLSGGQKQRLALARALLFARDKDIILLDESTSSVDPETEVQIYQNIFSHFRGKTFLASIHKMNLLKYFDRIVMFESGSITGHGTFDELIERNTKFKTMWDDFVRSQN